MIVMSRHADELEIVHHFCPFLTFAKNNLENSKSENAASLPRLEAPLINPALLSLAFWEAGIGCC